MSLFLCIRKDPKGKTEVFLDFLVYPEFGIRAVMAVLMECRLHYFCLMKCYLCFSYSLDE